MAQLPHLAARFLQVSSGYLVSNREVAGEGRASEIREGRKNQMALCTRSDSNDAVRLPSARRFCIHYYEFIEPTAAAALLANWARRTSYPSSSPPVRGCGVIIKRSCGVIGFLKNDQCFCVS